MATHKGNYSEALNAGIAAFRAGEQPHILQVFEVGTATMMAAEGAIKPVYEVMDECGARLRSGSATSRRCTGYYTDAGRQDAVAALQLLHAGAVREPRRC